MISRKSAKANRLTAVKTAVLITAVLTAVGRRMSWFFKSWRPAEKKDQARELRIATSESYSIRTSVEPLSVDGAGSYTSASKLRAALFVPEQSMTIKFHPESTKKSAARGQCVH